MSVADEISRIKGNIASAYTAAGGKGATMPDVQNSANLAGCIDTITGGGGAPVTKFGASVDTWIGEVDANGVLQKTTWTGALNFAGVKEIGNNGLQYVFYERDGITSIDLSSLQTIGEYGMYYAFHYCIHITSINLSSLQTIGAYGMYYAFKNCTGITSVDLSSLQTIGYYGMNSAFYDCGGITSVDLSSLRSVGTNGLFYAFYRCTNIASIDLSSLQSVGTRGLQYAFYGCSRIVAVSFPELTDVQTDSFGSSTSNGAFKNCTALTEIHFRADMQATIEAMSQYANKWGAPTTCSILFDL